MASTVGTVFASEVYVCNAKTGERVKQTGSTATISTSGNYAYSGSKYASQCQYLDFDWDFESEPNASTKRFVKGTLSLYLLSKSVYGAGDLPSGSSFDAVLSGNGGYNYIPSIWSNLGSYSGVSLMRLSDLQQGWVSLYGTANNLTYSGYILENAMTNGWYSNVDYNVSASITIQTTGNAPKIDGLWYDIEPTCVARAPAQGSFVNEKVDNCFTYKRTNIYKTASGADTTVASCSFLWREVGSSTIHEIFAAGDPFAFTVPADTFPSGSIEYSYKTVTNWGFENTDVWTQITTVDSTPETPADLSPVNEAVDNNGTVLLSWVHHVSTASPQSKADIQYSTDNAATWVDLATVTGPEQRYSAAANTIPAGSILWRVRTYNTDIVAGPWSAAANIVVRSSPAAPVISSMTQTPRPTVSWQQSEQVGYRVVFRHEDGTVYDTGEQYGNAKSVKCPLYLENGAVAVTVYVGNAIGLWSSSVATMTVANAQNEPISMQLLCVSGAVKVSWSSDMQYDAYYVIRDGIPIAKCTSNSYLDKASAGSPRYCIMGVCGSERDYFTKSNSAPVNVMIRSAILYDAESAGDYLYLTKHRDAPPVVKMTDSASVQYQHYSGRAYPCGFYTGYTDRAISMEFTVKHGELPSVLDLVGKMVCVKLYTGEHFFAVLDSVAVNKWRRDDVSLSLTAVDHREEIDYD